MKILTIVLNLALFLFTGFVLMTDGTSEESLYILFSFLLVIIPLLNVYLLLKTGIGHGANEKAGVQKISIGRGLYTGAMIGNLLLLGFAIRAMIDQYPHPQETGFIEYASLVLLSPILSMVMIWRNRTR